MTRHSTEPRTKKYVKGYEFLSFTRKLSNKYGKELLDTAAKTELDAVKTASKKAVHGAAEATAELIGNKIAEKNVKTKPVRDENSRNVEEIVFPPEERQEILNELRQVI